MKRITLALLASLAATQAAGPPRIEAGHPSFAPVTETPSLPRVLLIGDSISMGYTLPVRAALRGIANVLRPPTNCGATPSGLQRIDGWLGTGRWDVIHFNFGLHDLRYLPSGEQLAPPARYEKNLRLLIARLKQTGAALIFATTTPVRQDEHRQGKILRQAGAEEAYNAIALRVTKDNGVPIDDLCAAVRPRLAELQVPNDLHFTAAGYEFLAKHVAESIQRVLPPHRSDQ